MSIGLAIIGCGTVGRIRAVLAREHPAVSWVGPCNTHEDTFKALAAHVDADFTTTDPELLLAREEVTAVTAATGENEHVDPILAAVDRAVPLSIEKGPWQPTRWSRPGARRHRGSRGRCRGRLRAAVPPPVPDRRTAAAGRAGRRSDLGRHPRLHEPDGPQRHAVRKITERSNLTPMAVFGTHRLDMSMFLMGGKQPVDFTGNYPPGDVSYGLLWDPMREETMTWFHRLAKGVPTPDATACDGHRNLILTMAMDRSAQIGQPVPLPIHPEELLGE